MQYKTKRRLIIGISLLLLVLLYVFKNYSFMIRAVSVIFGLLIFYFFDHAFQLHFHFRHYVYILIILIFGILLSPFYFFSEIYDKILHLLMPILGSIVVFFVISKAETDLKWKLLITLTSMVFFLTMIEIGEYLFDVFLDLKLQGVYLRDLSGLEKYKLVLGENDDTMIDLILGTAGSLFFILGKTAGFYYKRGWEKVGKK